MNYPALILCSLIILFVFLLFFIPFANAYQMDLLWQWGGNPHICIWDNKYNHLFEKGVNDWNDALYSLGKDWPNEYKIIYPDTPDIIAKYCNINLVLVEHWITEDEPFTGVIGRTVYSQGNMVFISVFEERNSKHYFNFNDAIVKTVKHELGHGFGLGHWVAENTYEAMRPWPATIMWGTSDKYYNGTIDQYSLDALTCWYGEDGFGGKNDRVCKFIQTVEIPKIDYTKQIFTVKKP